MSAARKDYWPPELEALIGPGGHDAGVVTYKPGWMIWLGEEFADDDGAGGLKLFIVSETVDSYDDLKTIRVRHEFLVPRASYSRDEWIAWLFDRYRDVEAHEAGEFFMVTGVRVFGPHHGNGENPYRVWFVGDHADTRVRAGNDKPPAISDEDLNAALRAYGETDAGRAWLASLDLPARLPELYGDDKPPAP